MQKMTNVIFWDNDINERKRALKKMNELGYNNMLNGHFLFHGINEDSDVCNRMWSVLYSKFR